jgi:hypothetical protein
MVRYQPGNVVPASHHICAVNAHPLDKRIIVHQTKQLSLVAILGVVQHPGDILRIQVGANDQGADSAALSPPPMTQDKMRKAGGEAAPIPDGNEAAQSPCSGYCHEAERQ